MEENPRPRMVESREEIWARQDAQVAGQAYGQAAVDVLLKTLTDEDLASAEKVAEHCRVAQEKFANVRVSAGRPMIWYDAAFSIFANTLKQRSRLIPQEILDRVRTAETGTI